MNTPKPVTPRQRLQALLAIPERDRTDAEWDEINELEISLASALRQPLQPDRGPRLNAPPPGGRPPKPGGGGGGQGGKRFKRSHKRPPRRDPA
jgi:hypothetical protein